MMKMIVGSRQQEEKINEIGTIANRLFPGIDTMIFKGTFRRGIRAALKNNRFQSWEEVAGQDAAVRRNFFRNVLDNSRPYLKGIGLSRKNAETLLRKLEKENEKYVGVNTIQ